MKLDRKLGVVGQSVVRVQTAYQNHLCHAAQSHEHYYIRKRHA
jgi:hypothetical protein